MPSELVDVTSIQHFINNEFVPSASGQVYKNLNPTTGEKIGEVAQAEKADVDHAVAAARAAFKPTSPWRTMDASARGALIAKLGKLIEQNVDAIAEIEVLDNGKSKASAVFDIKHVADTFHYYSGWADKIHGSTIPVDGNSFSLTKREPVGVVGAIVPWNYPLVIAAWKLGPALAAGCTVVLKPAEQTPLSASILAKFVKDVGFPAGVVNVVNGPGLTGSLITHHMDIDKVAFTGSTEVGRLIMAAAAKSNLKRVSLELGGKSPLVVMDDADLDEAVEIAHNAIFTNHGQCCCAGSRTYVQENIYDEFVKKATARANAVKVGDPFAPDTDQGPQIDDEMLSKVLGLIESGKKQGATLCTGGSRIGTKGFFVQPTVFANVTDDMRIAREEIFGPVQSILKFKTLDEAIERSNNSQYGLAAGIVTKDINKALKYASQAQAGSVWINCYDVVTPQTPFGGFKQSGHGRDLGEESLKSYLEVKTVTIQMPNP